MNVETFGERLREYRVSRGLSQREVGQQLGMSLSYVSLLERGVRTPAERVVKRFENLLLDGEQYSTQRVAVSPPVQSPDDDGSDGDDDRTSAPAAGPQDDLPPTAEEPPPFPDDEPAEQVRTPAGRVSSRSLSTFDRIEWEMLALLVGKEIPYMTATSGGVPQRKYAHQAGLCDFMPAGDARIVRAAAPELAHGYAEWAKSSPRVLAILKMVLIGGPARQALQPTLFVAVSLLMEHGILPKPGDLRQYLPGGQAAEHAAGNGETVSGAPQGFPS